MNTFLLFEDALKEILQSNIKIHINNRVFKEGRLILYKPNIFSYELTICNKDNKTKKIELPMPFKYEYHKDDGLVYLDYRVLSLTNNRSLLDEIISISKKSKSRYYNTIVEIEILG